MDRINRRTWIVTGTIVFVLLVAASGLLLYARGGGPLPAWMPLRPSTQDPLARSGPAEAVLRTMRLAGIRQASVGSESGSALLRLGLHDIDSAADVEIAWQAGLAALSVGYPSASDYIVQVFMQDRGLVQVAWDGETARDAIENDDATVLDAVGSFTFLSIESPGADEDVRDSGANGTVNEPGVLDYMVRGLRGTPDRQIGSMPTESLALARELRDARPPLAIPLPDNAVSMDVEYSGMYLDAKNHAAELASGQAMLFDGAVELGVSAGFMRGRAPGIPALPSGVDAGQFWAGRGIETLRSHADVPGASRLANELEDMAPGLEGAAVAKLRAVTMGTIAVARAPFGTVYRGTAASASAVRDDALTSRAGRDAVLAAARDPQAPESATKLTAMERERPLDATLGDTVPHEFPAAMLQDLGGAAIHYWGDGETRQLNPDTWLAYRREDGVLFWRADEDGEVAVTDASLLGWAWVSRAAAVVDAENVGLVYDLVYAGR